MWNSYGPERYKFDLSMIQYYENITTVMSLNLKSVTARRRAVAARRRGNRLRARDGARHLRSCGSFPRHDGSRLSILQPPDGRRPPRPLPPPVAACANPRAKIAMVPETAAWRARRPAAWRAGILAIRENSGLLAHTLCNYGEAHADTINTTLWRVQRARS